MYIEKKSHGEIDVLFQHLDLCLVAFIAVFPLVKKARLGSPLTTKKAIRGPMKEALEYTQSIMHLYEEDHHTEDS